MSSCIWCCRDGQPTHSDEHIVPEVLGCPPELILRNREVCTDCNNRLGTLDAVLADSFDAFRVFVDQRGKRGRPPRITGRANLRGEAKSDGADFTVNMGPGAVDDPRYGLIKPPTGKQTDATAQIQRNGPNATISFQVSFGHTFKFSRAIHKIAYEYLALLRGTNQVSARSFAEVRAFVIRGHGERRVLALNPPSSGYEHWFGNARLIEHKSWCVDFKLCGIPFFVDLSPSTPVLARLGDFYRRECGLEGWALLPPEPGATD